MEESSFGRTATMAWTLTSGITDNTDVYIEQLDPVNPQRYLFQGSFQDMDCRSETFMPKGHGREGR